MRVCIIGTIAFPSNNNNNEPKSIGGIPGYVFELVKNMLSKQIKVYFVGKIYNYESRNFLFYWETQKKLSSTNKFLISLFIKSFSIKLPRDTIIHAHRPDHLAAFTFFKNNPSIVTLHGQQAITIKKRKNFLIRYIFHNLERIALNKAKYILATDIITRELYCKTYPNHANKIEVIPTGIDIETFKPLNKNACRSKYGFSNDDKIILYLGRIEPPKKVADIIKAFELIHKGDKHYKLLIVGDGKQLNNMKILSQSLGLTNSIFFFGARMRKELPEIINCADISVLYSENEGSPLAVKESLACGVPVVANRVGDVDIIIKNGRNGCIIEKESINDLASAMEHCIANANDMRDFSVKSCEEYSIEKINNKVISIYQELEAKQKN